MVIGTNCVIFNFLVRYLFYNLAPIPENCTQVHYCISNLLSYYVVSAEDYNLVVEICKYRTSNYFVLNKNNFFKVYLDFN